MKNSTILLLRYSPLLILALALSAIPGGRLLAGGGGLLKYDPRDSHFQVDSMMLDFESLKINTGQVGREFHVRYTRGGGGGGHSRLARVESFALRNNSEGVFRFNIQSPKDAQISPLIPPDPRGKQFSVYVDPGKTPGLTVGEKFAQLVLFLGESEDQGPPEIDSVTINLHVRIETRSGPGTIYPARVRILSDTVSVGELFNLELQLDSVPTPIPPGQSGFHCTIIWNGSLALPVDSIPGLRMMGGQAALDINSDTNRQVSPGNILLSIPMRGLLGDAQSTGITISNFHWDAPGMVSPVRVGGVLTIRDIYNDSGSIYNGTGRPRLINANGDGLELSVVPDLVKTDAVISATYGTFAQLKIYNLSGVEVGRDLSKSLSPASGTPVTVSIPISREDFPGPGTYLLRLMTGRSSLTRMIIVE
ncbi:MAG: hypothetical protein ABIR47_17625, partial [Candidatus Kapaibacterium sp.]